MKLFLMPIQYKIKNNLETVFNILFMQIQIERYLKKKFIFFIGI